MDARSHKKDSPICTDAKVAVLQVNSEILYEMGFQCRSSWCTVCGSPPFLYSALDCWDVSCSPADRISSCSKRVMAFILWAEVKLPRTEGTCASLVITTKEALIKGTQFKSISKVLGGLLPVPFVVNVTAHADKNCCCDRWLTCGLGFVAGVRGPELHPRRGYSCIVKLAL